MLSGSTISDLLYDLYAFPDQWDFHTHVLHVLDSYIPSALSGYDYTFLDSRIVVRMQTHNHKGVNLPPNDTLSTMLARHPFIDHYCANRGGPVLCTLDLLSEDEWESSKIYNDFYAPCGVYHDASLRYYNDRVCISFIFTSDEQIGTDSRRILNLVAQHLENVHRSFDLQKQGLYASLPDNVALLSTSGQVIEYPTETRRLLRRYYPSESTISDMPDTVHQWILSAIRQFHQHDGNLSGNKLAVEGEGTELVMSLLMHPAGFLLLLEETRPTNPIKALMAMGLTMREAEVLQWVAQGKQNSDVATILGIRTATVRKHVEHILHKLDCETRGAAALFALRAQRGSQSDVLG